jgi:acyl transferase domain-containing protein
VGGCNIISTPESISTIGNMGFLSPDGRCYSFDQRGNGYARSEGLGVLILKRVTEAIRDQDVIRAVIRATGTNQDGRTVGLAQPCAQAQESLLRSTYQAASLDTRLTRFVEAHGTGTAVGDPLEAAALSSAFGAVRNAHSPVYM